VFGKGEGTVGESVSDGDLDELDGAPGGAAIAGISTHANHQVPSVSSNEQPIRVSDGFERIAQWSGLSLHCCAARRVASSPVALSFQASTSQVPGLIWL
jgi:hypothetical protein